MSRSFAEATGIPPYRYDSPQHGRFGYLDEIDEKVVCHICGRCYRTLAPHVSRIHGLSADEYREAFGLSHRQPLAAVSYSRRLGATVARLDLARHVRPWSEPGTLHDEAWRRAKSAIGTKPKRAQDEVRRRELYARVGRANGERMRQVWAIFKAASQADP